MTIKKPAIPRTFFYGPIISYQFLGDISKDKGGYRIRYKLTFKSGDVYCTQKSGFKSESEARKAKELLIAALVRNEYIPFDYTVKDFFDYWLYYYMLDKKHIRYNTFQSYRNLLYNHFLPSFGEKKRLGSISVSDVEKAVLKIPYPSVRRMGAKVVPMLFDFACQKHYISFNPAMAAADHVKSKVPKKKNRDVVPYTVEELKRLLYTCKQNFADMYYPLLLSLTIGTRISETIGILYSDVDFRTGTVYIKRQLGRNIMENEGENLVTQKIETKTPNGVRSIPVPEWVIDELIVKRAWYEKQKQLVPGFQDTGYICCHCDGRPFNRTSFLSDFHVLTSMCGLQTVNWHDLRHMYASILKNNAVNMKAVSEFLGHYSPDFSEEVYVHHEETAYDCSTLCETWKNIRPENDTEVGERELILPFSGADYLLFSDKTC